MTITITSIKLKSLFSFFALSLLAYRILGQTRKQHGFVEMKSRGLGYLHYTISMWESESSMKEFSKSGHHLDAMKQSGRIAQEIITYSFEGSELPGWTEAKSMLKEKGRIVSFSK